MTAIGNIAGLAQTGTALATAGVSFNLAKKKNKKVKDFIKVGATTIVGTSVLRAQGSLLAGL